MQIGAMEVLTSLRALRKDLKIALEEAEHNGARLDMTKLVDGYYAQVQELGGNRWDTSSLIARLEQR